MFATITSPIADLRAKPIQSTTNDEDPLQLTQLLKGEAVKILEEIPGWLHIEAQDQPQFTVRWHGYRGWVDAALVGNQPPAPLRRVDDWRSSVVATARQCLGWPYLWGGLGEGRIDCSGLVHLAYRKAGIIVPRDARDQIRRSQPTDHPEPGDLVFMSKKDSPKKIVHVMLWEDETHCLEATSYTGNVRRTTLEQRLQQPHPNQWIYQVRVVDSTPLAR